MLSIPYLPDGVDTLTAALAYAEAGWYVLPVRRGTKHPGSVVGDHWQDKSSRSPQQIVAWFAAGTDGIALHCGRSGAVVFDVDRPESVPADWRQHFDTAPFQSTRPDAARRGHYVFAMPPGRTIGNPDFPGGEIRGLNGVIIAEPTVHPEGGRYHWERYVMAVLPDEIAGKLDDASPAEDAATDAEITAFLAGHTDAFTGIGRKRITGLGHRYSRE